MIIFRVATVPSSWKVAPQVAVAFIYKDVAYAGVALPTSSIVDFKATSPIAFISAWVKVPLLTASAK